MKTTLKPYLLKRRKTANGLYPIYIRITQKGKYSLLSTEIYIEAKYWNSNAKPGRWVKGGEPSADAYNYQIQKTLTEIRNIILENENISRKQIVKQVQGTVSSDFHSFAKQFTEKKREKGQYHQHKHYKTLLKKITEFRNDDIRFNEITPQFLEDFKEWMRYEKKNHPNTIAKEMGRLKAIIKDAYLKGLTTANPFDDPQYKGVKKVQSIKPALSTEQINKIEELDLEKDSSLWHVRNYFMFSFYNAGIRFSDLAFLKWENIQDDRLIYQMGKNGKFRNIKLLPKSSEIIEYYRKERETDKDFIFPILPKIKMDEIGYRKKAASANSVINRQLKDIQKMAKIETNITFHIARHSFARWAKAKNMNLDFIGKALAHSKRATTEQYLDSLADYDMDKEMEELFN